MKKFKKLLISALALACCSVGLTAMSSVANANNKPVQANAEEPIFDIISIWSGNKEFDPLDNWLYISYELYDWSDLEVGDKLIVEFVAIDDVYSSLVITDGLGVDLYDWGLARTDTNVELVLDSEAVTNIKEHHGLVLYAGYINLTAVKLAVPHKLPAITNGTPESAKETNHGYITIDKETAAESETVSITVKPDEGYQLKSLTVTPVAPTVAGALKGEFTVSDPDGIPNSGDEKKVHFSQGNLVATIDASGAPTAWKFAANQYDCLGEGGANKTIGSAAGDVDLFGWSTSTNGGTSTTDNYGIKTSITASDYSGDFYDWGSQIGDGNTWRTLSKDEWKYLFYSRTVRGGTGAGKTFLDINYCGKIGMAIYPDGYTGSPLIGDSFDSLPEGVVFLPAAGYRFGSTVYSVDDYGYYWSSTDFDSVHAYYLAFIEDYVGLESEFREYGCSVRLVTSADAPETITPAKQQDGTYQFTMPEANVTVTAEFELHVHAIKTTHAKVEGKCEEAGHEAYYECDCGKYFSDEDLTNEITDLQTWLAENGDGYIAPLGHNFGGQVTYTWNGDQCTATRGCQHDGCTETQTETVTGVYVKDSDATTESNEKGHYEATFTVQGFTKQSTAPNSVEKPNTKLSSGLSGGAIAGIVIGSVFGLLIIAFAVLYILWKRKNLNVPLLCIALTPAFRFINKLFFKTKLNDVEAKEAENKATKE